MRYSVAMDVSLEDIDSYAQQFVESVPKTKGKEASVVALEGDLGAGKTTFVQAVARAMEVKEHVTSPTFTIMQSYKTEHPVFSKLVHIDAYRLEGEIKDTIGFEDVQRNPSAIIFIEWPKNILQLLISPKDVRTLIFKTVDETTRNITEETHA